MIAFFGRIAGLGSWSAKKPVIEIELFNLNASGVSALILDVAVNQRGLTSIRRNKTDRELATKRRNTDLR